MKKFEEIDNNASSNDEEIDIKPIENSSTKEQEFITDCDSLNNENESSENSSIQVEGEKVIVKKSSKKKTIIISTIFSILFALIGSVGGYLLYNLLNPKNVVLQQAVGEVITDREINNIETAISNNNIVSNYKDSPYTLINYSLYLHAISNYSLVLGQGSALAAGVTQNIRSATFRTPDEIFNENTSSSSIVSTANRYYDKKNNVVEAIEGKKESDWENAQPYQMNYDEYISKFGKLLSGIYYCTSDENKKPISDTFLTLDKEEFEKSKENTKFAVNSIIIYSLSKKTVSSSELKENSSGYEISISLKKAGESYYAVQMKTTGGLRTAPDFDASQNKLIFNLDKNLNLISSEFIDVYEADVGPIKASTSQNLKQYYFQSETSTFNSKNVTIPRNGEAFNGFELI